VSATKPIVQDNAGIFLFHWEQEGIKAQLDRINEDSKHNVHGELLVKVASAWDVPDAGHLYRVRINLLSASTKKSTAQRLNDRLEMDWEAMLEQICHHVLEKYRSGEPVVKLGDVVAPQHIAYRVNPLITDMEHNLIYGDAGIGKSLMAGYLAVLVSGGWYEHNNLITAPGPVLYLDFETSKEVAARRFRSFHAGLGVDDAPYVFYRFCYQPVADDIQEIQRAVIEHNIEFVIIDSAGPACGGEPESAQAAISYFAALRALRVTTLTIAHKAKTNGVGPFGSMFWQAYPRNVYEIKRAQEEGSDEIHVGLFHKKVNDGVLLKPRGFTFQFNGVGVKVTATDVLDIPEMEEELSTSDRVASLLRGGAMAVQGIAEAIDVQPNAVSSVFKRNSGHRFVKLSDGRWGLSQL
jgi:hypothetical protein